MRHSIALLPCLALAAACAACATVPETEFYILSCKGGQPAAKPVGGSVTVLAFDAAEAYAATPVAYRSNAYRLRYDQYRLWAAPPARLVREQFIACLQKAALFERVAPSAVARDTDYVIEGKVVEFCELDEGGDLYASLKLELRLMDRKRAVLAAASPRAKVKAERTGDLSGLAEAMSAAAEKAFAEFFQQVATRK